MSLVSAVASSASQAVVAISVPGSKQVATAVVSKQISIKGHTDCSSSRPGSHVGTHH